MKKFILITMIVPLFLAGCESRTDPNQPNGFIQIKGSDTIVNAEQMVAENFIKIYPQISIAVTGGGTGVGIASLINKNCEIAGASREMKSKEIDTANKHGVHPFETVVAFDGVAVIVNLNNPIDKLTIDQLHKIYTGEIKNWKELGGKDIEIVLLSREVSSGTHTYFKEQVIQLGKKTSKEEFLPGTLLLSSSQAIVEEVASNEGAIGYLGMGYVSGRTKSLMLDKGKGYFSPTVPNVISKQYPLSRPLYFYTDGEPNNLTKLFVNYALSEQGQQCFKLSGFVPLKDNATEIK